MKVENLENTADRTPPQGYSSFKSFYVAKKGFWPPECSCFGCNEKPDVGAHVKKVGTYDNKWYIAPLCYYHNNQFGEEIEVCEGWLLPINE